MQVFGFVQSTVISTKQRKLCITMALIFSYKHISLPLSMNWLALILFIMHLKLFFQWDTCNKTKPFLNCYFVFVLVHWIKYMLITNRATQLSSRKQEVFRSFSLSLFSYYSNNKNVAALSWEYFKSFHLEFWFDVEYYFSSYICSIVLSML